ncbi:MAG: MamI family restriction endonuclease [Flavobacterium sp.]|nr:MamI family restriction endonuclease [Flavobacterium sp.]
MQPDTSLITINDNESHIVQFLKDLIIKPRVDIHRWSVITRQTPTLKIGYIGQHLTSLILGMQGVRTGARGHDIVDGTEVKSCTKVDQVDVCKDCNGRVMRTEIECPHCSSLRIGRKDDSKWLFSIRTDDELRYITEDVPRIFLLISDYPYFKTGNFSSIRFEAFEIFPQSPRMSIFNDLLSHYFVNNYLPKAGSNSKTSPMNFHPYSFQFYMCNPIKVFSCVIDNIDNENSSIVINHYVEPSVNRNSLASEDLPVQKLVKHELVRFIEDAPFDEIIRPLIIDGTTNKADLLIKIRRLKPEDWSTVIPLIDEKGKKFIPLRDIVISPQTAIYRRA